MNSTRLELTTRSVTEGTHDVVVVDTSGVDGRLSNGFQGAPLPRVDAIFPTVGSAAGGTPCCGPAGPAGRSGTATANGRRRVSVVAPRGPVTRHPSSVTERERSLPIRSPASFRTAPQQDRRSLPTTPGSRGVAPEPRPGETGPPHVANANEP